MFFRKGTKFTCLASNRQTSIKRFSCKGRRGFLAKTQRRKAFLVFPIARLYLQHKWGSREGAESRSFSVVISSSPEAWIDINFTPLASRILKQTSKAHFYQIQSPISV